MKTRRIVLLGPPGAGKGTLATLIKENFGLSHISTGDIMREEMKKKTVLGKELRAYVERGELVPDEIVTKMIRNKFRQNKHLVSGFMLDGFPRTVAQAEDLDAILKGANQQIDFALSMEASLPVILQRLTGRRVCRACGALFHIVNKPPAKRNVCDECGGELYLRPDDNEDTIKTRIDVYLKNTKPIIDYYKSQNKLKAVNADKGAEEVLNYLTSLLDAENRSNQD